MGQSGYRFTGSVVENHGIMKAKFSFGSYVWPKDRFKQNGQSATLLDEKACKFAFDKVSTGGTWCGIGPKSSDSILSGLVAIQDYKRENDIPLDCE